jgi:polysaccharide deacetylase 2 family uncharacterized protein YibQ
MAMANDLSAPLQSRKRRRAAARAEHAGLPLARIGIALIVLLAGAVVVRLVLVDDPNGGRPVAEADINSARDNNSVAREVLMDPSGGPVTITADPQQYRAGEVPAREMTGAGTAGTSGVVGADTPFGLDPDLVEETEHGPIPRVSATGVTPFEAYGRPAADALASGLPKIALITVGLGINERGSLEAIDRLPDAVTLAFAPYGRSLETVASAARADGHEIFLEIPLEPFDYPENDPGPQTLLTGDPPRANLDKLFWLLARFGGYAGVINNMGARFTASGVDFAPVMEELGLRGLGYLDDGSSNRSLAQQLAGNNDVPFSRADLVVDDNPDRDAILAALGRLETRARETGSAIGLVSALPVSITTVSEWASSLEDKGLVLVPASALME